LLGRGDALLIFLTWVRIARIWLEWLACELWARRRDAFLGFWNADGTWSAENGGTRVCSGGGFLATFELRAWSFDASDEWIKDALLVLLARVALLAWIRLLNWLAGELRTWGFHANLGFRNADVTWSAQDGGARVVASELGAGRLDALLGLRNTDCSTGTWIWIAFVGGMDRANEHCQSNENSDHRHFD